jgi:acetyl-CoA carboxylase carboxyltransferase component
MSKKQTSIGQKLTDEILVEETELKRGGGNVGLKRQRRLGRLPVRERLARLLDNEDSFLELGLWAGYGMYDEWGGAPGAGVVTGIGAIRGRSCMVIANDATVKAGAFFPQTVKKVLRAQRIAARCSLPLVYLVDSSGVFLPLQDEIFPDEDDFGRIFRNNAVLSAAGVPQFAGIMGNCVAGGAYLPVLCDKLVMTEGSSLYLAGPALTKAAIGQVAEPEELGGARMHSEVSGTVDFHEPDDEACIRRLRSLIAALPETAYADKSRKPSSVSRNAALRLYDLVDPDGRKEYCARDLLTPIVDRASMNEYKADYGKTLMTVYAKVGGRNVGVVANERSRVTSKSEGVQIGGVIYGDSADKAARFVMDCSQNGLPLIFFQDVQGFMVGRDSEQSGIIRRGAKLVNAVSNAATPKITVIVGGSFGAGNYALCGKAFDPCFVFAWPSARYAVMGASQASKTLASLQLRRSESGGAKTSDEEIQRVQNEIESNYRQQMDIRYGAARGWVDAIIPPPSTREVLIRALNCATRPAPSGGFRAGLLQV